MPTFQDREAAFEAKFAHDAEMQFRAQSRANRLLALWAAGEMGKSGAEAEAFAAEVIRSDFAHAGHEDVVRFVAGALGGRSDVATVRQKRESCLSEAKAQLAAETP